MKINRPTKLTFLRLILSFVILLLLIFPFYRVGVNFPAFLYNNILVDFKYIVAGVLLIFTIVAYFFDKALVRKNKNENSFGNNINELTNMVLIDGILVAFSASGYVSSIISVVVVVSDIIICAIKISLLERGKYQETRMFEKIKTVSLIVGILFTFFYNLPFEVWNLEVSTAILYFGTIMAVISLIDCYSANKKILYQVIERSEE